MTIIEKEGGFVEKLSEPLSPQGGSILVGVPQDIQFSTPSPKFSVGLEDPPPPIIEFPDNIAANLETGNSISYFKSGVIIPNRKLENKSGSVVVSPGTNVIDLLRYSIVELIKPNAILKLFL